MFKKILCIAPLLGLFFGTPAFSQNYASVDMQAGFQSIGCHSVEARFDRFAYDQALTCFRDQTNPDASGPMTTEELETLKEISGITGAI